MAREDSRWFAAAVVILSLVLFLALPLSVLIAIQTLKVQSDVKYEIRQLKKLKQELKDATNRNGDSGEPNQQRDAQSSGSSH